MSEYALSEPFEVSGDWYVPNDSPQRVAGNFSWAPDKGTLQLNDALVPLRPGTISSDLPSHPIIHGITRDSKLVTLLNPLCVGREFNFGGGGARFPEKYIATFVIVGEHVDSETTYTEMEFRIPGLQIWLSRPIVQKSIETNDENKFVAMNFKIEGKPEEIISLPLINADIGFSLHGNHSSDTFSEISVQISAWMRIVPDASQSLDWFLSQAEKVTTLLALFAASSMAPDCIRAKLTKNDDALSIVLAAPNKSCLFRRPHEFFLLRATIGAELGDIIKKWFSLYEPIRKPSQLALSVMYSERVWVHLEFLTLMQALEGFHRVTTGGTYMKTDEYESVRLLLTAAIPENIEDSHKSALRAKIKYGNEFSLRRRLRDLVSRLSPSIASRILGGPNGVPSSWVDTRNYYTHWDESSVAGVLDVVQMHEAGVRMKRFLRALYLDLSGVPQSVIEKALGGPSNEAQYLMQLTAKRESRR